MCYGMHCTTVEQNVVKKIKNKGKKLSEIAELVHCSVKGVFSVVHFKDTAKKRGRKRATSQNFDDYFDSYIKQRTFSVGK